MKGVIASQIDFGKENKIETCSHLVSYSSFSIYVYFNHNISNDY